MRTLLTILMTTMMMLLTACGGGNAQTGADTSAQKETQTSASARSDQRVLVVYFSRADENTGGVGYIEKGNTKILAEMIAERTHGDLFEIKTVKPYPKEYRPATEAAKQEKEENARPEIVGELPDLSKYDVVFLGYPIWWSDMPMPVYTFLDRENFAGKIILPFCTHEGSGLSGTQRSIADVTKADVREGFALQGHIAQKSPEEARTALYEWMSKQGY
ncbi:flavodoxin [Selenomonas massiliensis]|uniref:flavodoxin n=1 Tax=Selenomonas massiliensis TaxID=2058293 RepID=UPI000D0ED4FC|nr:flavodoxin [Selenomonas massiliensis]